MGRVASKPAAANTSPQVYGQAAAVGSLVLVFGFKDTLRRMGAPFRLDDDK